MNFSELIREHKLLDIVTIRDTHYALTSSSHAPEKPISGCIAVTPSQLPNYLSLFIEDGYSQRHHQPYGLLVGLRAWMLFTYDLSELPAGKKQAFSHALAGTGGRKGLLASWSGQKIGRSAVFVPKGYADQVEAFFTHWNVPFRSEGVLRGN